MKNLTRQAANFNPPAQVKDNDLVRVFFALWPKPAIQQKLHAVAKTCQPECGARIMRTDTLHMTLQFIGNIKRTRLDELSAAADKVCEIPSFKLELGRLAFWKHNRIGYATLTSDAPVLQNLAAQLQQALVNNGFGLDSTRFSPHITLLRNVERILAPQDFSPISWQVNSFVLVESVISSHGAHYRVLKEWPLPT